MCQSDEEYARVLLEAYLRGKNARCEIVEDDPPDIVCRVASEKWAIEVTRVGEREIQNGAEKSRTEIDIPLIKFGNYMGEKVEPFRRLNYQLFLQGPPTGMPWATWKRQVQNEVEQFVKSDCLGSRDFGGGSIRAIDQGRPWIVAVGLRDDIGAPGGHMTSDISANIEAMLRHALDDKCRKLGGVSGFDRIGLVLLNRYPLAEDVGEVASILNKVASEDQKYLVFDVVFCVTSGSMHMIYDKRAGP